MVCKFFEYASNKLRIIELTSKLWKRKKVSKSNMGQRDCMGMGRTREIDSKSLTIVSVYFRNLKIMIFNDTLWSAEL